MRVLAGGDEVRPVWVNEMGGLTFEIGGPDRTRYYRLLYDLGLGQPAGGGRRYS